MKTSVMFNKQGILEKAREQVELLRGNGSYLDATAENQRAFVLEHLVEKNYPYFTDKFPSKEGFKNKMLLNRLLKMWTYEHICTEQGYALQTSMNIKLVCSVSHTTALTMSGSIVWFGTGLFTPEGARIIYDPLTLRDGIERRECPKGGRLLAMLEVGKAVQMEGDCPDEKKPGEKKHLNPSTSAVIRLYTKLAWPHGELNYIEGEGSSAKDPDPDHGKSFTQATASLFRAIDLMTFSGPGNGITDEPARRLNEL